MSFQDYVNDIFGCDVDLMDLTEEDVCNLQHMYEKRYEEEEEA